MPPRPPSQQAAPKPYCGLCNYPLEGLTESSKCPECGGPLVEVLRWTGQQLFPPGKRFRTSARLFGMPVVDLAFGGAPGQTHGRARGFIAIGDDALGVLAVGGAARGFIAIGGGAIGVFSFGGGALGLLSAVGGGAAGGAFALGGGFLSAGGGVGGGGYALVAMASGAGMASPAGLPVPGTLEVLAAVVAGLFAVALLAVTALALTALRRQPPTLEADLPR